MIHPVSVRPRNNSEKSWNTFIKVRGSYPGSIHFYISSEDIDITEIDLNGKLGELENINAPCSRVKISDTYQEYNMVNNTCCCHNPAYIDFNTNNRQIIFEINNINIYKPGKTYPDKLMLDRNLKVILMSDIIVKIPENKYLTIENLCCLKSTGNEEIILFGDNYDS